MDDAVPDWASDTSSDTPDWAKDGAPDWAAPSGNMTGTVPVKEPTSWGSVASQAYKNAPSSGAKFLSDMAQPFIHPVATATALKNIGQGALEKTGLISGDEHTQDLASVGHFLMNRYGSMEALKNTIATDPVGVAGDLSMLLTGGETAAARVPGVVGELARAAGTTGRLLDPVQAAASTAKLAGKVGAEGVGLMTGTGARPLETAASAGYEGGQAAQTFRQNMRGQVPMGDVVDEATNAVRQMRVQRGDAYRKGMADVGADKTVLDFSGLDKAMQAANAVKTYKGQSLSPSTTAIRDQIAKTIDDWHGLDPAEFHTAEGFDALKQKIGDIRDATAIRNS